MLLEFILMAIGIILLWKGSDFTIDGAKAVAKKHGLSETIIGLTIISIGTSLPEVLTTIYAGLQIRSGTDASGVAVGAIIGSEITQITLILGIVALIGIMHTTPRELKRDAIMLFVAIAGLSLAGMDGFIHPIEAIILVGIYLAYIALITRHTHDYEKEDDHDHKKKKKEKQPVTKNPFLWAVIGIALLIFGGKLVIDNAVMMADELGLSQTIIGILIIGAGTSLPELSIAIYGVRKKATGLSLGTLVGSNITDPLFSLGAGAIIAGFAFDTSLFKFQIPFWILATVIAIILMKRDNVLGKDDKAEGAILLALFATFIAIQLLLIYVF